MRSSATLACLAAILALLASWPAATGDLRPAAAPEVTAISVELVLRGLKWRADAAAISVVAALGDDQRSVEVGVDRGRELIASFKFEEVGLPAKFSVRVSVGESEIFALEGTMVKSMVKITRAVHDEAFLVPHGDVILEVTFTGRFYSVELIIPVRGEEVEVECLVDEMPVRADVVPRENGTLLILKDIVMDENRSTFTVLVTQTGRTVALVRGSVTERGLHEISIVGGVIERLNAKAIITTGSRKVIVPSTVLGWGFVAEETMSIVRTTELVITSSQVVAGNVGVRLRAFSRGSWLRGPSPIPGARFEVTLVGLNVTKVYEADQVAYLPEGEKVVVKAMAPGYVPKEETLVVTKETNEVTFYLEEASPSPLRRIEMAVASVMTHPLFVPIVLGIIMVLLLILLARGG